MFELIILFTLMAWEFFGCILLDFHFYGRRVIIKPVKTKVVEATHAND